LCSTKKKEKSLHYRRRTLQRDAAWKTKHPNVWRQWRIAPIRFGVALQRFRFEWRRERIFGGGRCRPIAIVVRLNNKQYDLNQVVVFDTIRIE
jgi:hypothetical protein